MKLPQAQTQLDQNVKKLVSVSATSMSMTDAREKALVLEHVPCIYYPI